MSNYPINGGSGNVGIGQSGGWTCAWCAAWVVYGVNHSCRPGPAPAPQAYQPNYAVDPGALATAIKLAVFEIAGSLIRPRTGIRVILDFDDAGHVVVQTVPSNTGMPVSSHGPYDVPVNPNYIADLVNGGLTTGTVPWFIDMNDGRTPLITAVRRS